MKEQKEKFVFNPPKNKTILKVYFSFRWSSVVFFWWAKMNDYVNKTENVNQEYATVLSRLW